MIKLIYIDTETTGVDTEKCAITQLAGIIRQENLEEKFSITMRPHEGAIVTDEALKVQGRTREEIDSFQDPKDALAQFRGIISEYVDQYDKFDKLFFIAYNAQFDSNMIRALFNRFGDVYFGSWFWTPPIDIMSLAGVYLMDVRHKMPNFKLNTVHKELFGCDIENAHDAMSDIEAARRIFGVVGKNLLGGNK